MHHFFLPADCFGGEMITFPPEVSKQIATVLRLKPGDQVVALDNRENAWLVELAQVSSRCVEGKVVGEKDDLPPEPPYQVTLFVSLAQREKFELILQKCTELGVTGIVPVVFNRSLVQSTAEAEAKRGRWEAILREAAEQCGRRRIPTLGVTVKWKDALTLARLQHQLTLILWEGEQSLSLIESLTWDAELYTIALFVGPEGGFSEDEVRYFQSEQVKSVTLGKRILRMETAAIAAVAIAMTACGDI